MYIIFFWTETNPAADFSTVKQAWWHFMYRDFIGSKLKPNCFVPAYICILLLSVLWPPKGFSTQTITNFCSTFESCKCDTICPPPHSSCFCSSPYLLVIPIFLASQETHFRFQKSPNYCCMLPLCSFATISAGERPQAAHLLRSWVRIPPGA